MAFCIGCGGYTVADAELAALNVEERIVATETSAELANMAIEADASEIAYAISARMVYNAQNNISMAPAELGAAVADDISVAIETGELPTAAYGTWEAAMLGLMEGQIPVDLVPAFSKMGADLIDLFNLEHPESKVELKAAEDAGLGSWQSSGMGLDGTVNCKFGNFEVNYGFEQPEGVSVQGSSCVYIDRVQDPPSTNANVVRTQTYNYGTTGTITRYESGQITVKLNGTINRVTVSTKQNGTKTVTQQTLSGDEVSYIYYANNSTYDGQGHRVYSNSGTDYEETYYLNGNINVVDNGVNVGSLSEDGLTDAETGKTFGFDEESGVLGNYFEQGGSLVGNDSGLDADGNYEGGTADINKAYDDDSNPQSWHDYLDLADVTPYKPSTDPETGNDEPAKPDTDVYDPTDPNPGKVGDKVRGDPQTPSRLSGKFDGKLSDLKGALSDKFPFSVPFNMATLVKKLSATPEAPHFTWVFDLPTGRETLEISLEDFSDVATVLRVMLNFVVMFSLIGLLVKIANLFELVNGGN